MDLVDELTELFDRLAGSDSFSYSDPASIVALERQYARFACTLSHKVASFAEGGEWAAEGAQSVPAWLATTCHLPMSEARAQLRRGQALPKMPLVAQAYSGGDIGTAQVDLLVKAQASAAKAAQRRHGVDPEAFTGCEEDLVQVAKESKFSPFSSVLDYFMLLADPDGAEESDMAKRDRRDVFLSQSINGMYLGQITLDPVAGAAAVALLSRLERLGYEADWTEKKAELGRDPRSDELDRTPAQRRADAFSEMVARAGAAGATDRRPEPLFSVLVGYETLYGRICQIEGGPIVSPGALLPWLERANFERIIFAPGTRIECSATARFFTGATRRAIEVRDQLCTHLFCEVPIERCQIDHIVPFSEGGETTQDNGRALCGYHNRLRNRSKSPDEGDDHDHDRDRGDEDGCGGDGSGESDAEPYDEGGP